MQRPSIISRAEKQPGVLYHLSEGMSLLISLPQLILIPVLLDLYLLMGPRISSMSITQRLSDRIRIQDGSFAAEAASWLGRAGDWDLSRLMALLLPSVVDGLPEAASYEPYARGYGTASLLVLIAAGVCFFVIGTALFTGFMITLARSGKLIRADKATLAQLFLDRWLKFLGFAAVMLAVLTIGALSLILPALLLSAGAEGTSLIVGFLSMGGLVLLVVTMFAPEAIVIDGAGPFMAFRSSARVVFSSFWQAMGLFAVSLMFSPGLLSIWEEIASDPVGLGIAIVINAGLVTSLAIASLSFYKSRSDGFALAVNAA